MIADEILKLLPTGKANAISGATIAASLGIKKRTVQEVIQVMRLQGIPICSDCSGNGGYYKASDLWEVKQCIASLRKRHEETARTIRALTLTVEKSEQGNLPLFDNGSTAGA